VLAPASPGALVATLSDDRSVGPAHLRAGLAIAVAWAPTSTPPPDTTVDEPNAASERVGALAAASSGWPETTCGCREAGCAHTSAPLASAAALGSDCRLASGHVARSSGLDGRAGSGSSSPPCATTPQASLASCGGPEAGPAAQLRGTTGYSQHSRPVSGGGPASEPGRQVSADGQDLTLVRYADGRQLEKGKPTSPASAASSRCLEEATTSSPLRGTGAHQAAASGTNTTRVTIKPLAVSSCFVSRGVPMQSDLAARHPTGLTASCLCGQAPPPPPSDTTVAELAADLEEERATATAMPGRSETTCGGHAAGIAHTSAVPDRAVALGSDCRLASGLVAEESGAT
jgi:hypothetical protein